MGYSPQGRKESDTTERLHYILPPMGDSSLGTTEKKKKGKTATTLLVASSLSNFLPGA